ncbi:zinc-dependent peptidase [Lacinutrix sp. MedPE-SW]|uniref:zinc-dependent peptidase n=1 Tax=Lacinutrix sp. MedPE-SW TaxID=1860087 RepID=UPI000A4FD9E3|nr:zinc-dependent peptidase [Lacinutrix sp. MedPE-SW]
MSLKILYVVYFLFKEKEAPLVFKIILIILGVVTALLTIIVVFKSFFGFFEMARVEFITKKQFFTHFYINRKTLPKAYKPILEQEFLFYKKLNPLEQKNFDHRIQYFINNWEFIGKDVEITTKMKVLIAATATKLTFGFREYKIDVVEKIVIYEKAYFSSINNQLHKGEFNLRFNALVFSWEDFEKGYKIENDNINLGVHECIHAMHFTFLKSRRYSTSAAIFLDSFQELTSLIEKDNRLKNKIINSGYFRNYAFENQFEFISVLVENFIETPSEFKSQFPIIYLKVKEMLNFNFAGY